ncbi:DMT family transporter [Glycomyces luteolus]|uniref:DMT family transporter n=1 Tax=Glycomyces luteolus TaxID=2670330 RepID=A0A9X3PAI0_9ACTN|nr:DMT family transporter [Glycomyces luteolus]MDA1361833.1 DMT family transporter [Glycomyces luteolus]
MKIDSSTIVDSRPALSQHAGLWWGFLGVLAFSFTLPFTRIAVAGLSPLFIGSGRAVIAAGLAAVALAATRQRFPSAAQWGRLAIVAGGVVVGFPMLTSYALTTSTAGRGAVVVALLPAATAIMVVLRVKERPARSFWTFAGLGAVAAVCFAALQGGGFGSLGVSDLLFFGAVAAAAIGYAEGGLLSRELGAWQTVSWALILAAPVMIALGGIAIAQEPPSATAVQWLAFAYLAAVSMYLGFFAWYRGLAIGPMAQVSQVQLTQPVMTIAWAALLLGEPLTWSTVAGGLAVIACAALAVRARLASVMLRASPVNPEGRYPARRGAGPLHATPVFSGPSALPANTSTRISPHPDSPDRP